VTRSVPAPSVNAMPFCPCRGGLRDVANRQVGLSGRAQGGNVCVGSVCARARAAQRPRDAHCTRSLVRRFVVVNKACAHVCACGVGVHAIQKRPRGLHAVHSQWFGSSVGSCSRMRAIGIRIRRRGTACSKWPRGCLQRTCPQ
jgi:hypothetical protein